MNIAFFGTSDRSLPILETLNENFSLALCVTKTDRKVGRKQLITETQVKSWAKENNVNYLMLSSMSKEEVKKLAKTLRELKIDLGIVADFSFIIPKKIIETPKYGLINIHFSLLPKLRGASPVQHAILNGLQKTGITYYLMDEKMDTGPILHQIEHHLTKTETTGSLYKKLFALAAENLPFVINGYINKDLIPKPQNEDETTYCWSDSNPKSTYIFKEDAKINWDEEPEIIERKIRAFQPWPQAWTILSELENNNKLPLEFNLKDNLDKDLRVKILKGVVLNNKLYPELLRISGKNEVDWESFLNGYVKS